MRLSKRIMIIEKNKVVAIEYTLKGEDNNVIDSSDNLGPLDYIHGYGNLIPGLEAELEGKKAGDSFSVTIAPADAYGERSDDLIMEVPRTNFEADAAIEVGMQFQAGHQIVTVTKIEGDSVTIDGNHELAGKSLHFDVKIDSVREATDVEIAEMMNPHGGCGCGGCGDSCEPSDGCGCGGC